MLCNLLINFVCVEQPIMLVIYNHVISTYNHVIFKMATRRIVEHKAVVAGIPPASDWPIYSALPHKLSPARSQD